MAQQTTSSGKQKPLASTEDIRKEEWSAFLDEFTRANRGAHASVEVFGPDVRYQVETENRPLDGISAETEFDNSAVWITLGSGTADHFTHGVQHVTAIGTRSPGSLLRTGVGNRCRRRNYNLGPTGRGRCICASACCVLRRPAVFSMTGRLAAYGWRVHLYRGGGFCRRAWFAESPAERQPR